MQYAQAIALREAAEGSQSADCKERTEPNHPERDAQPEHEVEGGIPLGVIEKALHGNVACTVRQLGMSSRWQDRIEDDEEGATFEREHGSVKHGGAAGSKFLGGAFG